VDAKMQYGKMQHRCCILFFSIFFSASARGQLGTSAVNLSQHFEFPSYRVLQNRLVTSMREETTNILKTLI
jgi:hypothetical protein